MNAHGLFRNAGTTKYIPHEQPNSQQSSKNIHKLPLKANISAQKA